MFTCFNQSGAELSSKKKLVSWETDDDEVTDDMFIDKTLELRQVS